MSLQTYLVYRRYFEVSFWVALFGLVLAANLWDIAVELARVHSQLPFWEPVVWESSSMLVQLLLIPVILRFDSYVPVRLNQLPSSLTAHLLFSLVFSIIHVAAMVALRKLAYALTGGEYQFGALVREFFYEYAKDIRAYATYLALIYLYRFILLRLQGEASLLAEGDSPRLQAEVPVVETPSCEPIAAAEAPLTRVLIKKLGREFLLDIAAIQYVEAAGNYLNLHAGGRIYPLRETMARFCERLPAADFARIHRSFAVNLTAVVEIQPQDSGDARVLLNSGETLPMSRSYRPRLLSRIPGG